LLTAKVFDPERDEVWTTPLLYGAAFHLLTSEF
jgi:hypothetical protein